MHNVWVPRGYQLYPGACSGIFFDEAPYLLENGFKEIYEAHNAFAHATLDAADEVSEGSKLLHVSVLVFVLMLMGILNFL